MSNPVQVEQQVDIFSKAIILRLSMSRPGNKRQVSTSQIEVDADKDSLHVSKDLLKGPEFEAISSHLNKLKSDIRKIALPSPMGAGHYLLPIETIEKIDARIVADTATLMTELLPAMMAVYDDRVRESMARLNGLANPADYPPADRFEAAFGIFHSYMTYGTPQALEAISKAIFDRESEKAKQSIAQATDAIVQVLVEDMGKLMSDLVERIESKDGGNKVKFKGLLDNAAEFLETIKVRNITENADLERLAAQARQILQGVDSQSLTDSQGIRTYVKKNVAAIQGELAKISTVAPLRAKRLVQVADAAA